MRARGLLVFSEMMALLLICLVMMSSAVNTCQGRCNKFLHPHLSYIFSWISTYEKSTSQIIYILLFLTI